MRIVLLLVCGTMLSAQEMRFYVPAMLHRGPNATTVSAEESKKPQAREKTLFLTGPMGGSGDLRGNFLFDTADRKLALEWFDVDPAIQAGTPRVERRKWYLAKGIGILEALKP